MNLIYTKNLNFKQKQTKKNEKATRMCQFQNNTSEEMTIFWFTRCQGVAV